MNNTNARTQLFWYKLQLLNLWFIKFELNIQFRNDFLHGLDIDKMEINKWIRMKDGRGYKLWIGPVAMMKFYFITCMKHPRLFNNDIPYDASRPEIIKCMVSEYARQIASNHKLNMMAKLHYKCLKLILPFYG